MRDSYMGGMCAFLYDISGLYGAMDMYEGQGQFISACLDLCPAGLEDAEALNGIRNFPTFVFSVPMQGNEHHYYFAMVTFLLLFISQELT